ncbi:hypothetical protein NDU88_002991 [Pleurodeles waltl]|uniref:Uncharacterized protein n=1 Tax=Pleurodeles waltl TaxID=8319 RepID=A0AAV7RDL4_PLEWA|nr:hypothetical protein NDU88_002991 [Pleurodeles waltl]
MLEGALHERRGCLARQVHTLTGRREKVLTTWRVVSPGVLGSLECGVRLALEGDKPLTRVPSTGNSNSLITVR